MAVNVLFLIFNIPAILLAYWFSGIFIPVLGPLFNWDSFITIMTEDGTGEVSYQLYFLLIIFFITVLVPSLLICIGPFQAGFAQVYKSIRTGTSVSLMGDFKKGLKENWKKSLAVMFIGIVITAVILLSISFYSGFASFAGNLISTVFKILFVSFILVQNFVYQIMVSTDLKLLKIYKNAILFLFLRFVPCLGLALIVILFYYIIPFILLMSASYMTLGIYLFLYFFILVAWVQYFISFYTGRLIKKYVACGKEKDKPSDDIELELDSEGEEN